ncbi:zf-HC2 domain-containing protein [Bacillus suaedaesalsae]|uniref:Zf-HC2 domain-containing protein n=1 Tax=Bacillus suaedaesalsae TaxID=2810349 RepID=A0ABS2DIN3_9BACI|nr:zf-HC2 domain-containing protein [Bacillus suaedaesalsae]MBM6618267.1 zf-HC2 domain-containing protein [Bacillus suaedaesalsae]
MNCNLVRDLLPLYIEKDCSNATNKQIESHLGICKDCTELHSLMNEPILIERIVEEEDSEKETSHVMQYYYGKIILNGALIFALLYMIIIMISIFID